MTFEELTLANEKLKTMDIKGKAYVQVNTRVLAFRELFPMGTITTEIVSLDTIDTEVYVPKTGKWEPCSSREVTMRATIMDENGKVLGTGYACEKEKASTINKTSFIENAETSAVGRALAMVGIGVDGSMCSAEELASAINQQGAPEPKKTATKSSGKAAAKKEYTPSIKDVAPSRDEMIAVVNRFYPEGSKPRVSLLKCFGIERIEDARDEQLYAVWNKFQQKKEQ